MRINNKEKEKKKQTNKKFKLKYYNKLVQVIA